MRRSAIIVTCVVVIASLTHAANADPISGTITLTVQPSGTPLTDNPYTYTGLISDLTNPPASQYMSGSVLGSPGPEVVTPQQIDINTPFNMTIALNGPSGSQATIDVAGTVTGSFDESAISKSSPLYNEGYNLSSSLSVQGTATSATLEGWTPSSGIPMSVITPYLNPSIYTFTQTASGMSMASSPQLYGGSFLQINLPPAAEAPEPATVLFYLAAIAGLGVRRGRRLWRS